MSNDDQNHKVIRSEIDELFKQYDKKYGTAPLDEIQNNPVEGQPLVEEFRHDELNEAPFNKSYENPQQYPEMGYQYNTPIYQAPHDLGYQNRNPYYHPHVYSQKKRQSLILLLILGIFFVFLLASLLGKKTITSTQGIQRNVSDSRTIDNSKLQNGLARENSYQNNDSRVVTASGEFVSREDQTYNPNKIIKNTQEKETEDTHTSDSTSPSKSTTKPTTKENSVTSTSTSTSSSALSYTFSSPDLPKSEYVSTPLWPAQLKVRAGAELVCSSGAKRTNVGAKQFCVIEETQNTDSGNTTKYTYETPFDGNILSYTFSIMKKNCSQFSIEQQVQCQADQAQYKPSDIAFYLANNTRKR